MAEKITLSVNEKYNPETTPLSAFETNFPKKSFYPSIPIKSDSENPLTDKMTFSDRSKPHNKPTFEKNRFTRKSQIGRKIIKFNVI